MEVTRITPDEFEEWNRFVDESPQGEVFCYAWWLDAVTRGDFKILAVRNQGRIEAGFPLAFVNCDEGGNAYFPGTLGILFRNFESESGPHRRSHERRLVNALLDQVPVSGFSETSTSYRFTDWLPFRWRGLRQTTRCTYLIHYANQTIEDLWNNVDKTKRRRIRRATHLGLHVEESSDVGLVHDFTSRSFARQGRPFRRSLEDLHRLDEAIQRFGRRAIFAVKDAAGEVHAVNYWIYRPQSTYGLHSGAEPTLRHYGGQALLFWHAIRHFYGKTLVLNFGGSDIEPIERFIRDFGGTQTPYFHIYNPSRVGGIRYHARQMVYHFRGLVSAVRRRIVA